MMAPAHVKLGKKSRCSERLPDWDLISHEPSVRLNRSQGKKVRAKHSRQNMRTACAKGLHHKEAQRRRHELTRRSQSLPSRRQGPQQLCPAELSAVVDVLCVCCAGYLWVLNCRKHH
jgi:hypothetical protein